MEKNEMQLQRSLEKRRELVQKREIKCQEMLDRYKYTPMTCEGGQSKTYYNHPIEKNKKKLQPIEIQKLSKTKNKKNLIKSPIKIKGSKFDLDTLIKHVSPHYDRRGITFNQYLRIQTLADIKIRPVRGTTSNDFLTDMKKLNNIRKDLLDKDLEIIFNKKEDTYNTENPEKDIKIQLENKSLLDHKWKNFFTLSEYQNFFLDELKGKISNLHYRTMLMKFRQISQICFAAKRVNYSQIKNRLTY